MDSERIQKQNHSQSFLTGSLVLILGGVIVKLIGAAFKIPMGNILTENGMAYFNSAYQIFVVIQVIAMAGLPVAISRMVAENIARKRYRDVKRIYRVSFRLFLITGIVGTVLMVIASFILAPTIKNPDSIYSMLVMAPAVFFSCMMSVTRGYYTGLSNMVPTAVSQIIEALAKLALGMLFAYLIISNGINQFTATGYTYGVQVATHDEALNASLPYAAAGAIAGVVIGTILGSIYLFAFKRVRGDGITREQLALSPPALPSNALAKALLVIAVPVAVGAVCNNLSSLIDTITVQRSLYNVVANNLDVIQAAYPGRLPVEDIHVFLYGCYSGFAIPIFTLVPSITLSFGISALPTVTSSWALGDKKLTKKSIENVLRITSLVAIPAGLGITVLARQILTLLYPARTNMIEITTPLLTMLGIAVIFLALTSPINSMLQAVGRANIVLKIIIVSAVIKLTLNLILVNIPAINIMGTPIGTIASYVFLFVSGLYYLCKITGIRPNFIKVFIRPLMAGLLCAVTAYVTNALLSHVISNAFAVIIAIGLAGIVYLICMFLLKAIAKDDILALPKGKNIAKALEKRGWID